MLRTDTVPTLMRRLQPGRARFLVLAGTVAALAMAAPALAQESSTELPLGGLALQLAGPAPGLGVPSMQIQVTPDRVTIRYTAVNQDTAPADGRLVLALPRLDFSDPDVQWAIPGIDPGNFVDATVKVDGKPLRMASAQTADLNGRNVTADLRKAKISLVPVGSFQNEIQALAPKTVETLAGTGVIQQAGTSPDGAPLYFPTWTVDTSLSAPIKIMPGKPVSIELSYRTSVGVSRDSVLRKGLRDNPKLASAVEALRKTYCIDAVTLAGVDKVSAAEFANTANIEERRIRVMVSPLVEARSTETVQLRVDKGRPDRITSFCSTGVRKIGPTTFQAESRDVRDPVEFRILLVGPR